MTLLEKILKILGYWGDVYLSVWKHLAVVFGIIFIIIELVKYELPYNEFFSFFLVFGLLLWQIKNYIIPFWDKRAD